MATPRLHTGRLLLREWQDRDRAPYAALNSDPVVMSHFPSTLTAEQSGQMVDSHIAMWELRGYGTWAVERIDTGAFIGFVMISSPSWSTTFTPCVEVGWRLAANQWGNGFAPEAATAAIDWAFEHVVVPGDEIVSFTTSLNWNSRRVMEKLGFVHDPTGDFDHPLLPDWVETRHVLYRMPRRSWRAV
jgi:RimJ/RimL family protein N-acetyltransferase